MDCQLDFEEFDLSPEGTEDIINILKDLTLKMEYLAEFCTLEVIPNCRNISKDQPEKCKSFQMFSKVHLKDEKYSEEIVINAQKSVHYLIASFKINLFKHGRDNDYIPAIISLLPKFLEHTFKASTIFIQDPKEKLLLNFSFSNAGIEAMEDLARIFILLTNFMILEIMEKILPSMLNYMVRNPIIKVFSNCLLGNEEISSLVSTVMLKYFTDTNAIEVLDETKNIQVISEMGDDISIEKQLKAKLLLSLLDDIFQAFTLFPDLFDRIQEKRLETFVKSLIDAMLIADNCYNYLYVLDSIFFIHQHVESDSFNRELISIVPHIFRAFNLLLEANLKSSNWCMLLGTILTVVSSMSESSSSMPFMLAYTKLIMKTIVYSSKENSELVLKGLTVFEIFVDNVDFAFVNSRITLPLKKDILNVLYAALHNPVKEIPLTAFRIIGKIGGYCRQEFADEHKSLEVDVCGPYLHFHCRKKLLSLPLPKVIDHAFHGLLNSKDKNYRKHCWSVVEIFLISYIISYTEQRNISKRCRRRATCLYSAEKKDYDNSLKTAFKAMFVSSKLPRVSRNALPLMEKVIECLIQNNIRDDGFKLLIDAAVLVICFPTDCVDNINIDTLKTTINKARNIYSPDTVMETPVLKYIQEKVINLLAGQTLEEKVAGLKVLKFLMETASLEWKINHVHEITRPLLNTVVDIYGKVIPAIYTEAKSNLLNLLCECFKPCDENSSNAILVAEAFNKTKYSLLYEIVSPSYAMRKEARNIVTEMFNIAEREDFEIALPLELRMTTNLVCRFHEDFDFSHKVKFGAFYSSFDVMYKIYSQLSAFCSANELLIQTQNDVLLFCGALNSLCFHFITKESFVQLLTIYANALLLPFPEITESASKCLGYIEYMRKRDYYFENIYELPVIEDWMKNFHDAVTETDADTIINRYYLCQLKCFIKEFGLFPDERLTKELIRHLNLWTTRTIYICRNIKIIVFPVSALSDSFYTGAEIINVFRLLPENEIIIKTVMNSMYKIEKCLKVPRGNPLKTAFLMFCKTFPSKVIKVLLSNLMYNTEVDLSLFEDFFHPEDCGEFLSLIKEKHLIDLGLNGKLSYVLQILKCLVKYDDKWLHDKINLADFLHKEWNADKLTLCSRSSAIHYINDFKLLAEFLLNFYTYNQNELGILFDLTKAYITPYAFSFNFLIDFVSKALSETSINLKAAAFFKFQTLFLSASENQIPHLIKIFELIIIPSFAKSLMRIESEALLKECNELHSKSKNVLERFLHCMFTLCNRFENVKLMFLKLSICMAYNLKKLDNYLLILECAKALAVSSNYTYHSILFLLIIEEKAKNLNSLVNILPKLFTSHPTEDEDIVKEVLNLSFSKLSMDVLSPTYTAIIDNRKFDLIIMFPECFYMIRHIFIRPMIKEAHLLTYDALKPKQLSRTVDFLIVEEEQLEKAVDFIEIIIYWGRKYLEGRKHSESKIIKNVISADAAAVAVNLLLRIACLVDPGPYQKHITKRSILLLNDVFKNKIFPLRKLEFGDWIDDLLHKISANCNEYENCEIFTLMTSFLPHLTVRSWRSFTRHLQKNIENLFKNHADRVFESFKNFLSKLIHKFPPDKFKVEFGNLYYTLAIMCKSKYFLIFNSKATVVEAIGTYVPSCVDNLISILLVLSSNSQIYDNQKALNVSLGFMTKTFFFSITEADRRTLFDQILHPLIISEPPAEIMLKIINIMDLGLEYLKVKEMQKRLPKLFVMQYSTLFEEICDKIQIRFSKNKEICSRFFEVFKNAARKLKRYISKIRITNVFAVFGTATCLPKKRDKCFKIVAKRLKNKLSSIISYICHERWKVFESNFQTKLCINVVSKLFKNIYITSNSKKSGSSTAILFPFSLLVELCYSNDNLAKHIWAELFPCIWNILREKEKQKLFDIVKLDLVSNRNDEFVSTALKCNPEFVYHVSLEQMYESFNLQTHCSMLFERILCSPKFLSQKNHATIVCILNNIYTQMEESDALSCIDENYAEFNFSTVNAISYYKKGNFIEAYNLYEKFRTALVDEEISAYEQEHYTGQMIKCAAEISKWDDSSKVPDCKLLPFIYSASKSNILDQSPLRNLIVKSKFYNLKTEDLNSLNEKEIYNIINHCIKKWKSLPQNFLLRKHYSLLELMQQLTELLEVSHFVNYEKLNENFDSCSQSDLLLEKTQFSSCRWSSRPYLLSDNLSFITELLNVRQKSLENIAVKSHELSFQPVIFAMHASNNFAIDLISTSKEFQNIVEENLEFKCFTEHNAFKFLKVKLSNLAAEVKKSVMQNEMDESKRQDLYSRFHDLLLSNEKIMDYFDQQKTELLRVLQCKILTGLGLNIPCTFTQITYKHPDVTEAYVTEAEYFEECLRKKPDAKSAFLLMTCLTSICKRGQTYLCHRLIPKILHLLEYDDENYYITERFKDAYERYDISDKMWIPYLPILISYLKHSVKETVPNMLETSICGLLQRLSIRFPQQVFFSLQGLKEIQAGGRNEERYKEISAALNNNYPKLVFKLDSIRKMFDDFPRHNYNILIEILKPALDKSSIALSKNLNNVKECLKEDIKEIIDTLNELEIASSPLLEVWNFLNSSSVEDCSPEVVINHIKDVLNRYIHTLSKLRKKFRPRPFLLHENSVVLSASFLENEIYLFDSSPSANYISLVKMHRFLPKVDIRKWKDTYVMKINICGDDGKIYSYSVRNDPFREESCNTVTIMQLLRNLNLLLEKNVQCSKRFLKFYFPRVTLIDTSWKIIPYEDCLIAFQDEYRMHAINFTSVDAFIQNLLQYQDKNFTVDYMDLLSKASYYKIPEKYFIRWINKLYSSPSEFFIFREKVLKSMSVLVAAEYLNICVKKEILVFKTGKMSGTCMELNVKEKQTASYLLTPVMKRFFGSPRIRVLAEYVFHILSCFNESEESWKFLSSSLHLMKKSYSKECFADVCKFIDELIDKVKSVKITEIHSFLYGMTNEYQFDKMEHTTEIPMDNSAAYKPTNKRKDMMMDIDEDIPKNGMEDMMMDIDEHEEAS